MLSTEEETFHGTSYELVAWANFQETIYYHTFGSYQGEWLLVSLDSENYFIYKGSYGSCSGCDHFESVFGYSGGITRESAKEFVEDYKPYLIVPIETMKNVCKNNKLLEIIPGNIREGYSEINLEQASEDINVLIKIKESLPITASEVIGITNVEYQQRALSYLGYDKFITESEPETLHKDGESTLMKVGNITFVSVKDSSTSRHYILRVPPEMAKVQQAIAWTFNLSEGEYKPLVET